MINLPRGLLVLIQIVRVLTVLGAVMLCVVPAAFWLTPAWVQARGGIISGIGSHPMVLDDSALALGALSTLPGVALGMYALWQLWCLFGEYSEGRVFGRAAQQCLRRFAWGTLLLALATPFLRALMGVALTAGRRGLRCDRPAAAGAGLELGRLCVHPERRRVAGRGQGDERSRASGRRERQLRLSAAPSPCPSSSTST